MITAFFACNEKRRFCFALAFLGAVLAAGLALYSDYGLSWDELAERRSGFVSAYSLVKLIGYGTPLTFSEQHGVVGYDRFYGMGFQHILLAAEYLKCGTVSPGSPLPYDLWLLRHAVNFFFVWCGLAALFFTGKLLWKNSFSALVPVVLFLTIPRFWAESFFNSKDLPLLAAFMISGYFLLRMVRRPSAGSVAAFAVSAAFASSVRLTGGIIFIAGVILIAAAGEMKIRRRAVLVAEMAAAAAAALVLFYPSSWINPPQFFIEAVRYMVSHPWNGGVLFCGKSYLASNVPWYYLPVWMAVTLPVPLMLFFAAGHFDVRRIFSGSGSRFRKRSRLFFYLLFYLSFFAVVLKCGTFYNGWRQFYFLAYPLIMISADGVIYIFRRFRRNRAACTVLKALVAVWLLTTAAWMVCVHPYQNLFFNVLAGDPNGKFELDYWHTSERKALEYIAAKSAFEREKAVVALNTTNYFTSEILHPGSRKHIGIISQDCFCRYFIYFDRPQWRPEDGGRPFNVPFRTSVKCLKEFYCSSSLFLHKVFLCRIYEFTLP